MSSSRASAFTRNVQNGVYHQHLFREELRIHERIVIRDGKPASSTAAPALTQSLASAFSKLQFGRLQA